MGTDETLIFMRDLRHMAAWTANVQPRMADYWRRLFFDIAGAAGGCRLQVEGLGGAVLADGHNWWPARNRARVYPSKSDHRNSDLVSPIQDFGVWFSVLII